MLFHPTLIMICFTLMLILVGSKNRQIFKVLALIFPFIALLSVLNDSESNVYELYNLKLLWQYDNLGKLISSAFLIVIFSSNLYALKKHKSKELIFGSLYGSFAIFTILSQDFISMFIGIEIMMIFAAIIIFIGGKKKSKKAAQKYFLTHLVSSNMILIGITHIITQTNSTEIVNVGNLIDNPLYLNSMIYILFFGMVINIAAYPFSGWMVNYYRESSSAGFLYLINFTTKVSIILLIKLFSGFEGLKYIGVVMILYAGFKAIYEDHLTSFLCYLSIIAMGVMVIGIGLEQIWGVACYLFIHIMYKHLLSLCAANLADNKILLQVSQTRELISGRMDKFLKISIFVGVALMINSPLSLGYYSKLDITSGLGYDNIFYLIILLANFLMLISLPWKNSAKSNDSIIKIIDKYSLILILMLVIILGFLPIFTPLVWDLESIYKTSTYTIDLLKQTIIFTLSAVIIFFLKISRKINNSLNLIDLIFDFCSYVYNKYLPMDDESKSREHWSFNDFEEQIMVKVKDFHNQQTAIFTTFLFFVITLCLLNMYI